MAATVKKASQPQAAGESTDPAADKATNPAVPSQERWR
jgi:hypothetical protein